MEDNLQKEELMAINESDEISELNQDQIIWYVLSIASWLLFVCCQIESFINEVSMMFNKIYYFFHLPVTKLFILVINLAGLIVYVIFTNCKKESKLLNGMLHGKSKFHFIPFILGSILFIIDQHIKNCIGEKTKNENNDDGYCKESTKEILIIADSAFSLLSIILFIFSYIQMKLQCKWYIVLTIKKGAFSCLIPYLLYKLLIDINMLIYIEDKEDLLKITVTFSVSLIGFFSFLYSLIFKDMLITFTNALIYCGLIIKYFLEYDNFKHSLDTPFKIIIGSIISIVVLLSIFVIVYLSIKHNELIFN